MNRKTIFKSFAMATALLALVAGMQGCYYDKEELLYHQTGAVDCTTISAKFSTDVAPIIKSKCATSGCHDAAGSAGGTVLETYTQIAGMSGRINQRALIDKTMPPSGALSAAEIAALTCWINSGTPNN